MLTAAAAGGGPSALSPPALSARRTPPDCVPAITPADTPAGDGTDRAQAVEVACVPCGCVMSYMMRVSERMRVSEGTGR